MKMTYTPLQRLATCLNARYILIALVPLLVLLGSCGNSEKAPDVSNIKVDLKTSRFDLDLYALDTNHLGDGLQKLHTKYPDFLDYFLDTLMAYNIKGSYSDTTKGVREDLKQFLTFKDYVALEETIKKEYPDCKDVDKELTYGFRYLKHYFPDAVLPKIIYLNMGLSKWATFPLDSTTMCIGLDMFLGDDFPHYKSVGLADYMAPHRRKSYIPASTFSAFYRAVHPFLTDDRALLDLMIQRGKEQYFLHKILPQTADTVLFGFTKVQWKWCEANESYLYNFFIQQNLLYNKEGHSIMAYIMDGPFAKGLEAPDAGVKQTPGNIGSYLGYKIVCAYMEQNPKTTLRELIDQKTEPSRFLDMAKYRPK